MSQQVIELSCPGCGARVSTSQKECEWCHKPIVIQTFNSIYSMSLNEVNKYAKTYKTSLKENPENADLNSSIAMCYLKLKMYDEALKHYKLAIEADLDNSETYFYAAISMLKGKKAFLAKREDIDKILEYVNAANIIETKGIYLYFLAYIKYDYFERKRYKTSPSYLDVLKQSKDAGLSENDVTQLFNILSVECPDEIK